MGRRVGKGHSIGLFHACARTRGKAGVLDARILDLRHSFTSFDAGGGLGLPNPGKRLEHRNAATLIRSAHLADDPVQVANRGDSERDCRGSSFQKLKKVAWALPSIETDAVRSPTEDEYPWAHPRPMEFSCLSPPFSGNPVHMRFTCSSIPWSPGASLDQKAASWPIGKSL